MLSVLAMLAPLALAQPLASTEAPSWGASDDGGDENDVDLPDLDPVVGGAPSAPGAWPDAAGVVFQSSYVGCTGVLIAPNAVLTAGHCAGSISHVILNSSDYQRDGELIPVSRTYEYPSSQRSFDISVLVLARDVDYEPRLLALDCVRDEDFVDGAEVAVVGFGTIDKQGNRGTTKLMEGFTFIQDADCSEDKIDGIWSGCNRNARPAGEVGAGGNGVDACFGDSGGPLYLQTDRGDFLAGLTSRAYAGVDYPCGQGGIYVRPDAVVDWIEEKIGRTLPRPQCNEAPEPTVDSITVAPGGSGSAVILVNDPDGSAATYELLEDPAHGSVTISNDGEVTYTADRDYYGPDTVLVSVTDDGSAYEASGPISVDVTVPVAVTGTVVGAPGEGGGGCGCASTPAPASLAWLLGLGVLPLLRRRR